MKRWCVFIPQDRAFLGVTTLKDLVLKRPQGPMSTEDFLQTLLELTMSDIELVGITQPWTHTVGHATVCFSFCRQESRLSMWPRGSIPSKIYPTRLRFVIITILHAEATLFRTCVCLPSCLSICLLVCVPVHK